MSPLCTQWRRRRRRWLEIMARLWLALFFKIAFLRRKTFLPFLSQARPSIKPYQRFLTTPGDTLVSLLETSAKSERRRCLLIWLESLPFPKQGIGISFYWQKCSLPLKVGTADLFGTVQPSTSDCFLHRFAIFVKNDHCAGRAERH